MPTGGLAEWLVPLLWKTAASFAMNIITNKLTKKKASTSPTYSMGALQTQCNSNMVMPIIYGRVQCAGNSLWQDGSGKTINRLVGFGIGRNRSVSEVKLNDMPLGIDYLFGIINTQYADATVRIYKSNSPTNNDKILALYANGVATNITLAGKGDSGSNGLQDYNCYTTKLYGYVNTLGNGWYMSDLVVDEDYDCEDMKELPLTSCYNAKVMFYNSNWDGLQDCSYTAYMGNGVQEIDSRVTGATQVDKAKIVGGMKYDAYLAFTITASDKISGNPNVTAVWQGRIVKIYSTPTAYTQAWSNNVWCILDFMTSPDGCNIPVENIDVQSFIDAAAYAQPGDGTRDWQLNLILDEKKSRQDWLNEMLLCFRAYRTYQNGKHGILIDKPEPVSQIFTVTPTESIEITWQDLSEDTERIILKYIDPDYEWQTVGAPATMNPPFKNATYDGSGNIVSNGVPLAKTIEIHGVTNFKQASQLSWFYLNQAQTCGEYITYTCNKRALNRTIGDVIGIYDPITKRTEEGLAYKRYRIMAMTEPQGMSIQLYCREYNEALYSDALGSVDPVVSVSKLPSNTTAPPAVTDMTATEYSWLSASGSYINNIDIAFTPSNYFDAVSYAVSLSSNNGVTWRYLNTISATTYRIENVSADSYIVGIQPVNKGGIVGAKATVNIDVIDANSPPPDDLAAFAVSYLNGKYIFSWKKPSAGADVTGYEIRKGSTWDSGQLVKRAVGEDTNYTDSQAIVGTVTFFCKPYNSGGYSANALSDMITIDVLPLIQTLYKQDRFEQLCTLSGDGVIAEDYTYQTTSLTYEELAAQTYETLDSSPFVGSPNGNAVLLSPAVSLGTLVQACISITEDWVWPPDSANIYEISTSLDGINYSDFKLLSSGNLPMMAFQLRITLAGETMPAILKGLGIEVIASQNTINYSGLTIPVGGLELTFSQSFSSAPAVIISPNADVRIPKKENITVSGCKIYLLDTSLADVGGVADVVIVGI